MTLARKLDYGREAAKAVFNMRDSHTFYWFISLADFASDNLVAAETIAHIFDASIDDWDVASDGALADGRY